MDISKKNTNASPSLNGWNFQVAAAIYLFLSFMKDVSEIGLEKTEDIELIMKNKKIIYAQAKSSLVSDEIESESHYTEINKAMSTLEGRDNSLIEKLLVIFNYYKPFGKDTLFDVLAYDKKSFNDLNSTVASKLKNEITKKSYNLDLDKLEFWVLKFDGIEKHSSVLSFLRENLHLKNDIHYNRIIESWRILLYDNGADCKRYIQKEVLAGSVFREYLRDQIKEDLLETLGIDYLQGDIDEIFSPENTKYIELLSQKFGLVTQINCMYHEYMQAHPNIKRKDQLISFINHDFTNIKPIIEGLFSNIPQKEVLMKLVIYQVGLKYHVINEISEIMGL